MAGYIGVSIVVDQAGQWLTTLSYTNGRVIADGAPRRTLPLEQFSQLIETNGAKFINLVKLVNEGLPRGPISDRPLSYELKSDGTGLRLKCEVGDLESTLTYNGALKEVTGDRPEPFDITWNGFLLWVETLRFFIQACRGMAA